MSGLERFGFKRFGFKRSGDERSGLERSGNKKVRNVLGTKGPAARGPGRKCLGAICLYITFSQNGFFTDQFLFDFWSKSRTFHRWTFRIPDLSRPDLFFAGPFVARPFVGPFKAGCFVVVPDERVNSRRRVFYRLEGRMFHWVLWIFFSFMNLCCSLTCLHYRGLWCTWTCLHNRPPVLLLDVSTP